MRGRESGDLKKNHLELPGMKNTAAEMKNSEDVNLQGEETFEENEPKGSFKKKRARKPEQQFKSYEGSKEKVRYMSNRSSRKI